MINQHLGVATPPVYTAHVSRSRPRKYGAVRLLPLSADAALADIPDARLMPPLPSTPPLPPLPPLTIQTRFWSAKRATVKPEITVIREKPRRRAPTASASSYRKVERGYVYIPSSALSNDPDVTEAVLGCVLLIGVGIVALAVLYLLSF